MKELQPSLEQTKQTIVERIFRYAKDSPEKAAIICKDETTTYRDLAELIFSVSLFLIAKRHCTRMTALCQPYIFFYTGAGRAAGQNMRQRSSTATYFFGKSQIM